MPLHPHMLSVSISTSNCQSLISNTVFSCVFHAPEYNVHPPLFQEKLLCQQYMHSFNLEKGECEIYTGNVAWCMTFDWQLCNRFLFLLTSISLMKTNIWLHTSPHVHASHETHIYTMDNVYFMSISLLGLILHLWLKFLHRGLILLWQGRQFLANSVVDFQILRNASIDTHSFSFRQVRISVLGGNAFLLTRVRHPEKHRETCTPLLRG